MTELPMGYYMNVPSKDRAARKTALLQLIADMAKEKRDPNYDPNRIMTEAELIQIRHVIREKKVLGITEKEDFMARHQG